MNVGIIHYISFGNETHLRCRSWAVGSELEKGGDGGYDSMELVEVGEAEEAGGERRGRMKR